MDKRPAIAVIECRRVADRARRLHEIGCTRALPDRVRRTPLVARIQPSASRATAFAFRPGPTTTSITGLIEGTFARSVGGHPASLVALHFERATPRPPMEEPQIALIGASLTVEQQPQDSPPETTAPRSIHADIALRKSTD